MSATATRTILVVDDNPDDRAAIRRLLARQDRGYTILEAATGEAGLARVRADRPDCVILDFYLPDMDGHGFLDALAGDGERAIPVPVAMVTGQENDAVALAALERGAQDYLVKDGLTARVLGRAVENAIAKFRVQRELVESRAAVELRNHKLEVLQGELRRNLAELSTATQAKDQFMAIMSHEMRTPLNAIIGYADLLEMELDGSLSPGQREQVERIRVGGRHLLDLINDLLDLARADAKKLELDLRPVDLEAILEEVTALLEREAEAKGIELRAEPCGPGVLVQADLQRLRQILVNLVGNAIKFTDEGSVSVRCPPVGEDGEVRVEIADTGIGIDPEILPLVFKEFYQAKGDLTREHGGSGLGLAIAQRMARLMGGDIQVESVPGQGSTFTLMLRAADAGSEMRPADVVRHGARMDLHSAVRPRPASAPDAVVAFSDNAEALAELARQVHPRIRLVWTTDADRVPALTVREEAVLVLLDISSAGGAAWRAAYALQEVLEVPRAAVFLLPSLPSATHEASGVATDPGWFSMVAKPLSPEQLSHAVSIAAGGGRAGGKTGGARRRVLIVDDDLDSRRVAAKFLQDHDVEVREASDGESALVEMRMDPPDVVVLDLMMPVLDGFGVLATMRNDAVLARIPVVVLTAKDLTEAERQFLARTAMRVLQKGEHRLADVAALVLRAAASAPRIQRAPGGEPA